jgi:hypothetical protein
MSSIHSAASVFYRWSVEVFLPACTVKKLLDIYGWALKFGCKFAFKQIYVSLTLQIPQTLVFLLHIVYLAEMRILSYQAS